MPPLPPESATTITRADTSSRPQIARLTEMLRAGSTLEDPARMLAHFGAIFGMGDGPRRDMLVTVSQRGLPPGQYKVTRLLTEAQRLNPDNPELPNPWRDWQTLQTHSGGFLGEVIARAEPQLITGLDLRNDPVVGDRLAGMRSCLAIPHFDEGRALNWAFQLATDDHRWSVNDIERTLVMGNLLGTATRNLVTRRAVDDLNRRLEQQFDEVARVQQSLLPSRTPSIPGVSIATSYLTSEKAGGDYYDFFQFSDHHWGIVIADVSGHGAAAATVMAMVHAMLPEKDDKSISPSTSIHAINRRLVRSLHEGMFVTALFMLYDTRTGRLEFVQCGHPPARVRRAVTGRVEPLEGPATFPLGILEEYPLESGVSTLHPGDTLVMYTDGITEAAPRRNDRRMDMFGVERLDAALRGCSGEPTCALESIHKALHDHTGSMDRDDDQTLVVLQRNT